MEKDIMHPEIMDPALALNETVNEFPADFDDQSKCGPTGYPITDTTQIEQRPDGSFVLDGVYHVANTEEFTDKREEIEGIIAANPDRVIKLPAPTQAELLASAKAAKSGELAMKFDAACQTATVLSTLGFEIDANETANRNIAGLITGLEATDPEGKVAFCAHDNSFHEVDLAGLKTMQLEIIGKGQRLYQTKWELRTAIDTAETEDAVNAVEIAF